MIDPRPFESPVFAWGAIGLFAVSGVHSLHIYIGFDRPLQCPGKLEGLVYQAAVCGCGRHTRDASIKSICVPPVEIYEQRY